MKKSLMGLLCLAAALLPAQNLLREPMTWDTWRCWTAPDYKISTERKNYFRNNSLHLEIPLQKSAWNKVLLYKLVPLEDGQDYRLTFTVQSERSAELVLAAGIRKKPHYPNFSLKKLKIHPGKQQYDWSFRFQRKPGYPADAPSAISFFLGDFIGTEISIRDVTLSKVEPCPIPGNEWTAFVNASVYREAESDRARTVRLGFAAEWYFTFYCNGKEFYSTSRINPPGNGSKRFSPDDHPVDFELKKAAYAAEIAKSASGTPPTAQFNAAAAAYTAAKTYTEQLADQLFPPEVPEEIQASSMTVTAVSSGTAAEEVQPAEKKASTQTVSK